MDHNPTELLFDDILELLKQSPEDWSLRIRAIEGFIRQGKTDQARELVRNSPDSNPLPPQLQVRLHTLLTKGIDAAEPLIEHPPHDSPPVSEAGETEESSPREEATVSDQPPSKNEEDHNPSAKRNPEPQTERQPANPPDPPGKSLGGGLGALVEDDTPLPREEKQKPVGKLTTVNPTLAGKRWKDYHGKLQLTGGGIPRPEPPRASSPERISAVSLAVFLHLILFFLISLVAINAPRPKPPQLVVSIPHEKDTALTITRITKPTLEVKPTAAAAQAVNVLTSISDSSFSMPDVENTNNLKFVSMLPGLQPAGKGMSFSTKATEASDVNFFGISGGGKKIVFVIDATPYMLVDEKGGMKAYDKVKDEVGIMLTNLNRGTFFNILLYQGKRVVAFREKLVPGLPSNLRMAADWLAPLNRDYASLGLRRSYGVPIELSPRTDLPLQSQDLAHYTKCIQKAMEWHASAIFCITSGYQKMTRSPTPEMLKKMAEIPAVPGTPGTIDPKERAAWNKAVARTRAWLEKENKARAEKGISPKVVINFNQLVRQITGATPPRRSGGTPGTSAGGKNIPPLPPITYKDIEKHIQQLVKIEYKDQAREEPSLHIVLFLGEHEKIGDARDHFKNLVRKNRGKLKILNGLAALSDVTAEK